MNNKYMPLIIAGGIAGVALVLTNRQAIGDFLDWAKGSTGDAGSIGGGSNDTSTSSNPYTNPYGSNYSQVIPQAIEDPNAQAMLDALSDQNKLISEQNQQLKDMINTSGGTAWNGSGTNNTNGFSPYSASTDKKSSFLDIIAENPVGSAIIGGAGFYAGMKGIEFASGKAKTLFGSTSARDSLKVSDKIKVEESTGLRGGEKTELRTNEAVRENPSLKTTEKTIASETRMGDRVKEVGKTVGTTLLALQVGGEIVGQANPTFDKYIQPRLYEVRNEALKLGFNNNQATDIATVSGYGMLPTYVGLTAYEGVKSFGVHTVEFAGDVITGKFTKSVEEEYKKKGFWETLKGLGSGLVSGQEWQSGVNSLLNNNVKSSPPPPSSQTTLKNISIMTPTLSAPTSTIKETTMKSTPSYTVNTKTNVMTELSSGKTSTVAGVQNVGGKTYAIGFVSPPKTAYVYDRKQATSFSAMNPTKKN
jgi:hypothetical protein